ncbi:MAG: YceI family protein [Bacteroidales bacterium]
MRKITTTLLMLAMTITFCHAQELYVCRKGKVNFVSDAPLELIKAASGELTGALSSADRSFSFQVPSRSFEGFNSSLQRTHFNEDYMESELYPMSTFRGKIIEEVDLSQPGKQTIRAKGKLTIHGVEFDRIIRCTLDNRNNQIHVMADFTVFLDDHNITIPSIVNKKIAEEIKVEINLTLDPR